MKTSIRRIGNSLGVIVPKAVLDRWGVGEGDALEITDSGIRPPRGHAHEALDRFKRRVALEVAKRFTPMEIRAQTLANLHRWRSRGTWGPAYDEWKRIAESGDDGELYAAMIGLDEESNRMRQSMPFTGLLAQDVVERLREEA